MLLTKKQRKKERKKSQENNTPAPLPGAGNKTFLAEVYIVVIDTGN